MIKICQWHLSVFRLKSKHLLTMYADLQDLSSSYFSKVSSGHCPPSLQGLCFCRSLSLECSCSLCICPMPLQYFLVSLVSYLLREAVLNLIMQSFVLISLCLIHPIYSLDSTYHSQQLSCDYISVCICPSHWNFSCVRVGTCLPCLPSRPVPAPDPGTGPHAQVKLFLLFLSKQSPFGVTKMV